LPAGQARHDHQSAQGRTSLVCAFRILAIVTSLKIIPRADELHQGTDIVVVRRFERRDVGRASLTHPLKIMPARPVDRLCPVNAVQHGVRHDAGMPAVAVRKQMNPCEPVMQANRGF
jgi:hypothetical protein